MRRIPVLPTLLVTLAVAAMIALGLWQLVDRRPAKLAYLARLERNPALPAIAFPRMPNDTLLFRRTSGYCLQPVGVTLAGAGSAGFRAIAACRTGAEGPGMLVQMGTTRDPKAAPRWSGGPVVGYLSHAPDTRPLIATLFHHEPQRMMLVSTPPLAGLSPNSPPDVGSVPNNHLAYAGQWFFFAAVAAIVYVLALRRRLRSAPPR
ncbi:surfeit locus 1 family protein [Sphingomonas gellani]|uniref:SURF1-like protein n=1 Tax=Sphingomonas gellani TaxID=1166340 RepID=A0A1H8GII4_9SPHN|nr:SURF1 family cytochrome oxidase biogenesis protein [Sphingomonas gellani]SEN43619.1 surfeit locus 1 family protein [Sphingomonas gellani]